MDENKEIEAMGKGREGDGPVSPEAIWEEMKGGKDGRA